MPPTVAIIMRAFNEMPHVVSALDILKKQTCRDVAFFALDSGSTDGTCEALDQACEPGHLTRIPPEEYIPGKVINAAVSRIDHDIIVLLNADAIPLSEKWLERLIAPLLDERADAAYSRQVPRSDARFIVAYDYRRAYDPAKIAPAFYSAVACAFTRKLWEERRFPEQGYAEDTIWANKCAEAGGRILLAADSEVEHSHNYTLKELFAKRRRQARALAESGFLKPGLVAQTVACCREMIRDFFYALFRLKPFTIPYNIAYRVVAHAGIYRGLREGRP